MDPAKKCVEIAFCFFPPAVASCTIYTWVSHTFHLTQGEKTEFTKKKEERGRRAIGGEERGKTWEEDVMKCLERAWRNGKEEI